MPSKERVFAMLGGRLRILLFVAFSLIAALTIGLNTLVIARLIDNSMSSAERERVNRDMTLAEAFYGLKLDETAAISHRLVLDEWVVKNLPGAQAGHPEALRVIDKQITNKVEVLALGGTHFIAILDPQGEILVGRVLASNGQLSPMITRGDWSSLGMLRQVPTSRGRELVSTTVIPRPLLAQVGLAKQARVTLVPTPKAASTPVNPEKGGAGLAMVGIDSIVGADGQIAGYVLSAYLINNDFTLVDRIKEVAGVDTVTIFLGDVRVSTNVMSRPGQRAVGTRISQDVSSTVLAQGRDYEGRAYVVNDWFITRYKPLRDYQGHVVGSLYVGARESAFRGLVHEFTTRVSLVGLVCVLLAGIIALPVSAMLTRPIGRLVASHKRLAAGDMSVRVQTYGEGELAVLGRSFNAMVETLQRTQQELLNKENLASIGQLAAGVAHEINNPLGTILLLGEMLLREAPEGSQQQKDLRMIVNETRRSKAIVSDLLNFARQRRVHAEPLEVCAALQEVVEAAKLKPAFAKVEIRCDRPPQPPHVLADPGLFAQVCLNLLHNAADAMPDGGQITVRCRRVAGQRVEVIFTDTGSGIPEEHLRKIFTPFFTTKPVGQGTGLGLSIVYGIVKAHGGNITAESQPGRGTTFRIILPDADEAPRTAEQDDVPRGLIGWPREVTTDGNH